MPGMDGIETLKQIRETFFNLPVVMLTASNTVRTAVQAMKIGAVDYLSKPFDIEELTALIVKILETEQTRDSGNEWDVSQTSQSEIEQSDEVAAAGHFGSLIGQSEAMEELFARVSAVAFRDTTVLITGESGTGKELIARRIHELSPRANAPFVAINCAAIPETLIESELFGHEKGAFTHAVERRIGHFELADKGTLFLDEIGELTLSVQVKMLRFLQEQEFYRVGRSRPIKVDVRIVAATNRDLEELIAQKKFREDLFYRINVVSISMPPLRERQGDIPWLIEHFVKKYRLAYGNRDLSFDDTAIGALSRYRWPGNVRELENLLESLLALAPTDIITSEDLPRKIVEDIRVHRDLEVYSGGMSFDDAERRFESEMIVKALKRTNYVQTKAAALLGISRRILKYKMDKLGIPDRPDADEQTGT
jgi:DNA-binding NtrC family response regulator